MMTIKKAFKPLLAVSIIAALFSFSYSLKISKRRNTNIPDKPATARRLQGDFTPFDVEEVSHKVKDYATWRPVFDNDSAERIASGMQTLVVGHKADDANDILMVFEIKDVQKAKDMSISPNLKEAMEKAGVISKPDFAMFHVIRFNPDSKEKQWVMITHKVKDFDTWLKAFDNEGTANREGQGLIDVALARGIDDPNLVQIVFDIKDMAKAKASIFSDDKKKLMMSAGVMEQPKIDFYITAE